MSDHWPAPLEQDRVVVDEADAETLRVEAREEPDQALHERVVHVGQGKLVQVKHKANVVHHVFFHATDCLLLWNGHQFDRLGTQDC